MLAAFYDHQGPARAVLRVEEVPTPEPMAGEVRVRLHASGVNPSDVKSRSGSNRRPMPFPRIIPHSDGAGVIDAVGPGVSPKRVGERVWLWNAQWKRAWGRRRNMWRCRTRRRCGCRTLLAGRRRLAWAFPR